MVARDRKEQETYPMNHPNCSVCTRLIIFCAGVCGFNDADVAPTPAAGVVVVLGAMLSFEMYSC